MISSSFSFSEFRRLHLLQVFFQTLEPFFDLAEIADHEIELDILDVAQRIDGADMRNRIVFKSAQNVNERIHLAEMADVGGLFQRVLANGAYVHVLDRGMGQFLGMVEGGKLVEALVGDFGDSDVGFARVGIGLLGESGPWSEFRNRDVLPTCGRPMMPVFILSLSSQFSVSVSV